MKRIHGFLIAALLLSMPMISQAHVHVKKSIPAHKQVLNKAPRVLQVWFSGNVEAEWSKISVLDAKGARVDSGDARNIQGDKKTLEVSLKPLPPGTYEARLNVISSDGHRVKGHIDFEVR